LETTCEAKFDIIVLTILIVAVAASIFNEVATADARAVYNKDA
jgi:hypothetical protein